MSLFYSFVKVRCDEVADYEQLVMTNKIHTKCVF